MKTYADRSRQRARPLPQPRNMRAVQLARDQDLPLLVSFVGDTDWADPTVYCDTGARYDWSFVDARLNCWIFTRPGVDIAHTAAALLEQSHWGRHSYPLLIDVQTRALAYVVDKPGGLGLMPVRGGTDLWRQFFE